MRRWKVIDDTICFSVGEIITLFEDDDTRAPKFNSPRSPDGWMYCITDRLVEIDEDGNTIRTYKKGDKLDEGTLVGGTMNKAEAKKRLDAIEAETKALREILEKPEGIVYNQDKVYVLERRGKYDTYTHILVCVYGKFAWLTLNNALQTFNGVNYDRAQTALDAVVGRIDCNIHEFSKRDDALKFMVGCE